MLRNVKKVAVVPFKSCVIWHLPDPISVSSHTCRWAFKHGAASCKSRSQAMVQNGFFIRHGEEPKRRNCGFGGGLGIRSSIPPALPSCCHCRFCIYYCHTTAAAAIPTARSDRRKEERNRSLVRKEGFFNLVCLPSLDVVTLGYPSNKATIACCTSCFRQPPHPLRQNSFIKKAK